MYKNSIFDIYINLRILFNETAFTLQYTPEQHRRFAGYQFNSSKNDIHFHYFGIIEMFAILTINALLHLILKLSVGDINYITLRN